MNNQPVTSVIAALEYASNRHRFDVTKNEEPYINHILKVASLLTDVAEISNKTVIIAGILQNILERTSTRPSDISARFGEEVCNLVLEITDCNIMNESDRYEKLYSKMPVLSANGKLIRLADKIAQVESILNCPPGGWDIQRRNIYLHWAQNVINALAGTNEKLENYYNNIISRWEIGSSMVA